jgi:hypothetical protein
MLKISCIILWPAVPGGSILLKLLWIKNYYGSKIIIIYLLNRSVSSGEASLDAAADRGMRDGVLLFLWVWSRDEIE